METKLLVDWRKVFVERLAALYDADEATQLYWQFLQQLEGVSRIDLAMNPKIEAASEEWEDVITRLATGEPYQYIIGSVPFGPLQIGVNSFTLIPRPETEELIEWVMEHHQRADEETILDIGTGSGCIALSLKYWMPKSDVTAWDLSHGALQVARQNAKNLALDVDFKQKDVLQVAAPQIADLSILISNPPYVRELEKAEMHRNVLEFEPDTALYVSDDDPLIFYRTIAQYGTKALRKGGELYFEINQYLPEETKDLVEKLGYSQVELRKDFRGNWRMLRAVWA